MKLSLNAQIMIGAAIGVSAGIYLNSSGSAQEYYGTALYVCDLVGGIFINLLKMILIPLVFTSIAVGIANLRAHAQMGRVWKYTLVYFASTTALATLLGIIVVNVFRPGAGLEVAMFQDAMSVFNAERITLSQFILSFLSGIFVNPVTAMAQGMVLPTVVFALMLGVALVMAGDKKASTILNLLDELFVLIMMMVGWIMYIAPVGIMALLAKLIATQDVTFLAEMGKFMAVVIGGTLFHGCIVLPAILFMFTGTNPFKFLLGVRDALLTALSTSSSSATLPVTIRCVEENLKVDKNVAGFVLPLGATVNMDGTALYEAVAALFVANVMGVDLNLIQQVIIFFMAILASIGAPGIPSAGMVTMIMVLQSVGLPAEAIAILLPVDRILDAVRTMVNVEGDTIGSAVVQKLISRK
ncbi:MAG: glutamate:proton symporter [Omnitrophica WOR_2 bacterium RIFCSPHIGHO2_02_FULL_52_10]|nr:MAG: glutamate:proton symporter [Omnitrophica WOR_2 bacterium RIFCSPHIGHO2_02_FULL_52_10]